MKTFLWCDTSPTIGMEYDFIVVNAETKEQAITLAINEIFENADPDDRADYVAAVQKHEPMVLEFRQAKIIPHAMRDMTPLEELIDWMERIMRSAARVHLTPNKIMIRAREIQKKAETGIDTIKPITVTSENVIKKAYPAYPTKLIGIIGKHFGTGGNLYTVLPKGVVQNMNSGVSALLIVASDRKRITEADIGKEVEYEIVVEKIMSSEYNRAKIVKGI